MFHASIPCYEHLITYFIYSKYIKACNYFCVLDFYVITFTINENWQGFLKPLAFIFFVTNSILIKMLKGNKNFDWINFFNLCILNRYKITTIEPCKCGNEGKEGEKARQLVIYCDTYCRMAPKIMAHVIFLCLFVIFKPLFGKL